MQGIAKRVMKQAEARRIGRAVELLGEGLVKVESWREGTVKAYVAGSKGQKWAVLLGPRKLFCSCPDHFLAGNTCKHIIAVALHIEAEAVRRAAQAKRRPS